MLFLDEAPLTGPVKGNAGFAEWFAAQGPRDGKGRSLRDLDLRTAAVQVSVQLPDLRRGVRRPAGRCQACGLRTVVGRAVAARRRRRAGSARLRRPIGRRFSRSCATPSPTSPSPSADLRRRVSRLWSPAIALVSPDRRGQRPDAPRSWLDRLPSRRAQRLIELATQERLRLAAPGRADRHVRRRLSGLGEHGAGDRLGRRGDEGRRPRKRARRAGDGAATGCAAPRAPRSSSPPGIRSSCWAWAARWPRRPAASRPRSCWSSSFDDLAPSGAEVKGRIVLFDVALFTTYAETVSTAPAAPARAAELGAAAVLVRSVGPIGLRTPHTGSVTTRRGSRRFRRRRSPPRTRTASCA